MALAIDLSGPQPVVWGEASIAVIGREWTIVGGGEHGALVVMHDSATLLVDRRTYSGAELAARLGEAQYRLLVARQFAGSVVCALAQGLAVDRVRINGVPNDPAAGLGSLAYGEDERPMPAYGISLLGFLAAGVLSHRRMIDERELALLPYINAAHLLPLLLTTSVPATAFLFGDEARKPAGWNGPALSVDSMYHRAVDHVQAHETHLERFAAHLAERGQADPEQIIRLKAALDAAPVAPRYNRFAPVAEVLS